MPDYSASEDIFTRMFRFLVLVVFAELFLAFSPDLSGWDQAFWFGVGVAAIGGALAVVNRLRGRRWNQIPNDIGPLELAVFVLVPPGLRALTTENAIDFPQWVAINLVILGIAYIVTSYGLFPMIPWALRQMWSQVAGIVNLFAKSLPLLLLFSAFLFVNAEIWQVSSHIPLVFFAIVVAFISLIGVLFIGLGLRHTLDDLNSFGSWEQVQRLCQNSPIRALAPPTEPTQPNPAALSRGERVNLALLLLVAQLIQVALVSIMVAVFYVVFGLFTVGEETILQWTTLTPETFDPLFNFSLFGHPVVVTRSLVVVSGFIAAFSGLQFTVSLVTDETYRNQFSADLQGDLRELLAVRCRVAAERPKT